MPGVRPTLSTAVKERLRLSDPLTARAKASPIALVRSLDQILPVSVWLSTAGFRPADVR